MKGYYEQLSIIIRHLDVQKNRPVENIIGQTKTHSIS